MQYIKKIYLLAAKLHCDSYALFPHMTVGENITFGLRLAGALLNNPISGS